MAYQNINRKYDGQTLETFRNRARQGRQTEFEIAGWGIAAGVAGGLAEIAWVALYAGATGADPATIARGVTKAAGADALLSMAPVFLGVTIHMALAMMLGVALSFIWRGFSALRAKSGAIFPLMLAALVGVWIVNFFVVLPIVDPAFVHLLPYPVSLMSKLLFGLAAALVFRWQAAAAPVERQRQHPFLF